jgi:hypothetical protein
MLNIPVTIVDNFFDNPDAIKDYGLSLDFQKDPEGKWPGVRTKSLHEINFPLFQHICNRIIAIYFGNDATSPMTWFASCAFQKVDKSFQSGWIHADLPSVFTNIIYLNKNPNINSGTSIYKLKNNILVPNLEPNEYKVKAYKGLMSIENAEEKRKENNDQYLEVIKVHNEYNRLISFDAHLPHAAHDFFGDDEPRLTLIIFFNELHTTKTPIQRLKSIKS